MNELIKINQDASGNNTVSARDLHNYLEQTERFQSWFDRQLQYGFEEEVDYVGCKVFNALANQTLSDYAMTLDMAKELSMLARNEKGKNARQYFIACEKKLTLQSVPQTYAEALLEAGRLALEVENKNKQIETLKPKAEFFDQVTGSKDCFDMADVAKVCNLGVGRNILFKFLRDSKILRENNTPYQQYIDSGHFRVIESKFNKPDGSVCINLKTVVYQKGIDFIIKRYTGRNLKS